MRHEYLEYEPFVQKWLRSEEQEHLRGVDVDVCIEPESHCISSRINLDHRLRINEISEQNRIVKKLVACLYNDRVVQELLY